MRTDVLFLDTSIQIARQVHAPEMKSRIQARLATFALTASSDVAKQEFKRRLLKEAQYLLNQFEKRKSYAEVQRWVSDVLPPQQHRKRKICLQMLQTVFENADDSELTERSKRYLRTLLKTGLAAFDASVDQIVHDSGCACARYPVTEEKRYVRYSFGPEECSDTEGACEIAKFMDGRKDVLQQILTYLEAVAEVDKSDEIKRAEAAIRRVLVNPQAAYTSSACLMLGDLVIALESIGFLAFYTINEKESRHLCRALKQNLIVRPVNYESDDRLDSIG